MSEPYKYCVCIMLLCFFTLLIHFFVVFPRCMIYWSFFCRQNMSRKNVNLNSIVWGISLTIINIDRSSMSSVFFSFEKQKKGCPIHSTVEKFPRKRLFHIFSCEKSKKTWGKTGQNWWGGYMHCLTVQCYPIMIVQYMY